MTAIASVIIPAHNEARVLRRNLELLHRGIRPGELDVVVVCNGCRDDTAAVARQVPGVRVIEIVHPSKSDAVRLGNLATDVFPRVHLDADVRLSGDDLRILVAPLAEPGVLATAPRRDLVRERSHRMVQWYYDVWEELPQVREGLFGRGVIALSREGQLRMDGLPTAMSDDLVISDAFGDDERRVVSSASVTVVAPVTVRDLLRRRIRVATGNAQASHLGLRRPASATTWGALARLVVRRPSLAPGMAVFLTVTAMARVSAREAVASGDFTTWLRDESSRV